jgi:hypothetical protein
MNSCNAVDTDSSEKEKYKNPDSLSFITKKNSVLQYPLPTPLEVTHMLNKAGAVYNNKIANSILNSDKYFTENARALNLGVYGSDLSYAVSYNRSQEIMDYYKCCKKLQDALDIQTLYQEDIADQIEANLNNPDSLFSILTNSFKSTFEYLNENEKGAISVLILAGGWIEGMFISCKLGEFSEANAAIYQAIAEQKESLGMLLKLLEDYKENQMVIEMINDLRKIEKTYSEIEIIDEKLILTKDGFIEIKKEIEKNRKKIIENT